MWLYNPVCVGPGRKSRREVSREGSQINTNLITAEKWQSWPGCLKLTMSLVNVSLRFCTEDSHIFPTKNDSVFGNVVHIFT